MNEKPIKLKIIAEADGMTQRVVDAETGAVIDGVTRVEIVMTPYMPVKAIIEVSQPAVEIQAVEVKTLATKLTRGETYQSHAGMLVTGCPPTFSWEK